jgi:hypothetical protein
MASKTSPRFLFTGVAALLAVCSQAHAQEPRWSLDPLRSPFPCGAVKLQENEMTFQQSLIFVCNGNDILEMPAGSLLGINLVCIGTGAVMHHDFDQPGGLFSVVRKQCGRSNVRRGRAARRRD